MTPCFSGYLSGITGVAVLRMFWDLDEAEAWIAGYTDGLADRVVRPTEQRFAAQFAGVER